MPDFLNLLFSGEGFPPRWYCGEWSDLHGWLHILSDVSIFGAYMAIPLSLAYYIRQRSDVFFARIFWLFCAFIFFCGMSHAIDSVIFWHPWYRFSTLAKIVTAIVSWVTVFHLIPLIPRALKIPALNKLMMQLRHSNNELRREIARRVTVEEELQIAKRELQIRNNELQQFFYSISHDMKSPIATIAGFADLLSEDITSGNKERAKESLERIRKSNQRSNLLMDELLHLSKIGQLEFKFANTDPLPILKEIWESLLPNRKDAILHLPESLPHVYADSGKLAEIFENLLINSLKYSKDGQQTIIEIMTRHEGGLVLFGVRDNGKGIAPQFHERVFRPFACVHPGGKGSGLGLTIVRMLVEKHGGEITLESELGQGSTFWFSIPAAKSRKTS